MRTSHLGIALTALTAGVAFAVSPYVTQSSAALPLAKPGPVVGGVLVAPYVDMGLWPTADLAAMSRATGIGAFTAAFIVEQETQPCVPAWGGYAEYAVGGSGDFHPIITRFQRAGGIVIPSFGGAAGSELAEKCTSDKLSSRRTRPSSIGTE